MTGAVATRKRAAPSRALITISVMLASVMQSLDTTIANVALPHIRGNLSATQEQVGWVLTSYIIAAAIMTPLSGWLAGRYGRKKVFVLSIICFTVASAACGMAQSLTQLVVFRFLQGVGGAALVPLSQSALLDINPPENHGKAMAFWAMGVTLGPVLGPTLGGWLTQYYSWRWVFYINLPFGVLAVLGIMAFMRETQANVRRFDFLGFGALSLAIGSLQLLLDRGQTLDWFNSTEIWTYAVLGAGAFYVFMVHTLTSRGGFISPGLFRDRNFTVGSLFVFIIGVVLFAELALLPPLLQNLMGYPVLTTGLVTAPRGIGGFISMILVGRIIGKVDSRWLIGFGFAITLVALWMMCGFNLQMDDSLVIWSGFIQGLGTGFAYVPLATITFATLSPRLRDEGTAMFNLLRQVGSSIGIAYFEAVLFRGTQTMHARLAEYVTPFPAPWHWHLPFNLATTRGLEAVNGMVTRQAGMIAYLNDFKLMFVLILVVMPLILLLRDSGHGQAPAAIE